MTNEEIIKGLQATNEHIGKHFNEDGAWMAEFIDNAIKELKSQRWTPVSEPPKKSGEYLLDSEDFGIFVGEYDADMKGFGWWREDYEYDPDTIACIGREFIEFEGILAWQPLPQPYKAESEE